MSPAARATNAGAKPEPRVDQAPQRISAGQVAAIGLVIAALGAILALTLKSPDSAAAGIKLQSLGAVLIGLGAVVVAGAGIAGFGGSGGGNGSRTTSTAGVQTIGSLIAVVAAIVGVVALAIVTQQRLSSDKASSIVAIATAAFGVVSAVVGAYLGIKVTADQSADAQAQARLASAKLGAATAAAVDAAPEDKRDDVRRAVVGATEHVAEVTRKGGRGA
jgi:hypothetical protein